MSPTDARLWRFSRRCESPAEYAKAIHHEPRPSHVLCDLAIAALAVAFCVLVALGVA